MERSRTAATVLPGVTVDARGDVLPAPRTTVTGDASEYRLPALPPGNDTLTFTLAGMQSVTRQARVQLEQDTLADVTLSIAGGSGQDIEAFRAADGTFGPRTTRRVSCKKFR
jgi:hypothetical protein